MTRICFTLFGMIAFSLTPFITKADDAPDALAVEWQGKKPCENLYEDHQIRVLRCTFAPGAAHLRHSHPATFNYVLAGGKVELQSEAGIVQREIPSDAHVSSPPVSWHEVKNVGDTTLRMLLVEKKY
jgi:quercetin dioxygenase-like cupin family protein